MDIRVTEAGRDQGWTFDVEVSEGGSSTRHRVTLAEGTHDKLSDGRHPPQEVVHACFRFLLSREPKESILRTFDVDVIGRYFPGYEAEVRRLLAS
jgi:hypothetical protein